MHAEKVDDPVTISSSSTTMRQQPLLRSRKSCMS